MVSRANSKVLVALNKKEPREIDYKLGGFVSEHQLRNLELYIKKACVTWPTPYSCGPKRPHGAYMPATSSIGVCGLAVNAKLKEESIYSM